MPEEMITFRKKWLQKLHEKDHLWLYCNSGKEMELYEKYKKLGFKFN